MRNLLLAAAILATTAAVVAPAEAIFNPTTIVAMEFFLYVGPVTVVTSGGEVRWENHEFAETIPHTVTADDGSFASGTVNHHGEYRRTFSEPAGSVILYHCDFHPWMRGVVVVA